MITVEVERHGTAAISEDDRNARYDVVERLHAYRPAGAVLEAPPTRVLVEVLRRVGGMAPRAIVGGVFLPGPEAETAFEVCIGGTPLEGPHAASVPGTLWRRPFVAGLRSDFAGAVLEGVTQGGGLDLPAGRFTVDRSGFDEVDSSTAIFRQAATLLRHVIAATLHHRDVHTEARTVISTW